MASPLSGVLGVLSLIIFRPVSTVQAAVGSKGWLSGRGTRNRAAGGAASRLARLFGFCSALQPPAGHLPVPADSSGS